MIEVGGNAEAACQLTLQQLQLIDGIGTAKAHKIAAGLREASSLADEELARCAALGVVVLCPDDAAYPALLKNICDPPVVLYVKGTLEPRDLNAVAIVGSRKCSFYGREQAERFAALLAVAGMTVVSGGARGIDSAAHRGALSHPAGRTIAVLGCGVDVVYPPENAALFDQIGRQGAVISEFPLGTRPNKENFPRRNRVVSGLCRGVLVVEADEKSGALITARQACDDHGRPVFALPGRVDNPLSSGCHRLIRDGAILASKLEHILEALGPLPQNAFDPLQAEQSPLAGLSDRPSPQPAFSGTPIQAAILNALRSGQADPDGLIDRTGLPAAQVLAELTLLSLRGQIRRVNGQTYELVP